MKRRLDSLLRGGALWLFVGGVLVGSFPAAVWRGAKADQGGLLVKQAALDLGEGDYEFHPNRRSIWVINRATGRMANYNFRDDDLGTIDQSRIATVDLNAFPRRDTVIHLSDRNLSNILWVCNVRTGDVQMWYPTRDGSLQSLGPLATSAQLIEREPAPR